MARLSAALCVRHRRLQSIVESCAETGTDGAGKEICGMQKPAAKIADAQETLTSHWWPEHLDRLAITPEVTIPSIPLNLPRPLIPGLDLWDMWPAQLADGRTADFDGATLWFVLSAPVGPDPDLRHFDARIRLLTERNGQWHDCGNALPGDLNPGSREWAGSAVYDEDDGRLTLYFTAAGHRGDARDSWAQRLFEVDASVTIDGSLASLSNWSAMRESLVADDVHYVPVLPGMGIPGFIKGFRDPAFFQDPISGRRFLLFTASLKQGRSDWNGAIGIAEQNEHGQWQSLSPLVSMDGVNNELERPHIIVSNGHYYLFFSTQTKMFAPGVIAGPNGLYAMFADQPLGPWLPVNGSGLVAANPASAPFQCYSWWVTDDRRVHGFADLLDCAAADCVDDPQWRRSHFGGVPAPRFRLILEGDRAWIADDQ
jgi:levansucrase